MPCAWLICKVNKVGPICVMSICCIACEIGKWSIVVFATERRCLFITNDFMVPPSWSIIMHMIWLDRLACNLFQRLNNQDWFSVVIHVQEVGGPNVHLSLIWSFIWIPESGLMDTYGVHIANNEQCLNSFLGRYTFGRMNVCRFKWMRGHLHTCV